MLFGRDRHGLGCKCKKYRSGFSYQHGIFCRGRKEMRSSKTGNEAVDGKYSVFSFFETPRHYFVKCFEGSNQSKFYLYGLDKATGELKRETSPINAQELFKTTGRWQE